MQDLPGWGASKKLLLFPVLLMVVIRFPLPRALSPDSFFHLPSFRSNKPLLYLHSTVPLLCRLKIFQAFLCHLHPCPPRQAKISPSPSSSSKISLLKTKGVSFVAFGVCFLISSTVLLISLCLWWRKLCAAIHTKTAQCAPCPLPASTRSLLSHSQLQVLKSPTATTSSCTSPHLHFTHQPSP